MQKKVMRGYWWYLFLFVAVTGFLSVFLVQEQSVIEKVVYAVLSLLYIIAYFVVPRFVKPVSVSAAPAAPLQNVPLAAPAQLTIVRDRSIAGAVVPYIISLNGKQACTLYNGASQTITLTMKHNVLLTNAVGSSKVRYEFDAMDGAVGEIHVKGGVFLPKTMKWN